MSVRVLLEPPETVKPPKRRRVLNAIRLALLLAGVGALGYCAYVYLDARVYETYQNWAFDQRLKGATPTVQDFIRHEYRRLLGLDSDEHAARTARNSKEPELPREPELPGEGEQPKQKPPAEPPQPNAPPAGSLIGRIDIPRLKVRAMVQEGVDDTTLRRAVGHVPGTALPGEDGNVGLAGHRDTFFRGLRNVRKNDRIVLETEKGDYEYIVDWTKIVTPRQVEVLAPSEQPALTLVTCYPFYYVGHAPKRFIVRARQVKTSPPELPGS
jgi:sortase A